jgi:hypothetical protein
MRTRTRRNWLVASVLTLFAGQVQSAAAQTSNTHAMHEVGARQHEVSAGQAAFATIQGIVKLLKADSTTNWSKVNLEALRVHLVDMNDVMMNAQVTQRAVVGGLQMDVMGTGQTKAAIQRMLVNHGKMVDASAEYRARTEIIDGGVRFMVTAKQPTDAKAVAIIRGLGFAGLMTEGNHHAPHHLALARGQAVHHP